MSKYTLNGYLKVDSLSSSTVEQETVNLVVAGSSPILNGPFGGSGRRDRLKICFFVRVLVQAQ